MNNDESENFIGDGFAKIGSKYITKNPPRIAWGQRYQDSSDAEKIRYLEKFARSMNHAADLVQCERNELNDLCEKKEAQLIQMNNMLGKNNEMLQAEVTRMNAQRQHFTEEMQKLKAKIRELESGDID